MAKRKRESDTSDWSTAIMIAGFLLLVWPIVLMVAIAFVIVYLLYWLMK
jgi:uncharacterized membrane protein